MRVILLNADGLPVWALGAYGNDWLPTPNLDEFAGSAVVFDQHFADVPRRLTLETLHGRYCLPTTAGAATPVQELHSVLVSHGVCCSSRSEELADVENAILWYDAPSLLPPWDIDVDSDNAEEIELDPNPQIGWVDPNDEHIHSQLQESFAVAMQQFDEWFGSWIEQLQSASLFDESLIIVTTGRGQNLGEHGMIGEFRPWLHEELVHLPLIMRLPSGLEGGRRASRLTQTVDLAPTILAAFGLEMPREWHGHDLLPLCRGGKSARDYAVMASRGDGLEYALQSMKEKLIVPAEVLSIDPPRTAMYFVKPDDCWEVNNLRLSDLDHAEMLEKTLLEFLEAAGRTGPLIPPPLPRLERENGDREAGE